MKQVYFCDFETSPFQENAEENYILTPLLFVAKKEGENIFFIYNLEEDSGREGLKGFLFDCANPKHPSRLFFHNLKFDMHFLIPYLAEMFNFSTKSDEKKRGRIIESSSQILEIKCWIEEKDNSRNKNRKRTCLEIRDTLALLRSPLKKMGEMLDFEKGVTPLTEYTDSVMIDYCKKDCELLEKAIVKMCDSLQSIAKSELKPNNLPLTIAGLSKKLWLQHIREIFGRDIFYSCFDKYAKEREERVREYFFGGRVEVLNFNVLKNGYYHDYNSFYPSIMLQNKFPSAPYQEVDVSHLHLTYEEVLNDTLMAAIIEVEENSKIPLIPIRTQKGKVLFPKGKKIGFVQREELTYLQLQKCPIKFIRLFYCSGWFNPFESYISIIYKKRRHAKNEAEKWFFKILMNSLYGKFAELREKEMIYLNSEVIDGSEVFVIDNELISYELRKEERTLYNNIFWSIRITSLCRLQLTKDLLESDSYYCDTDSLSTQKFIKNSSELGQLKVEHELVYFQGIDAKEYCFKDKEGVEKFKRKGFKKEKEDSISHFISHILDEQKFQRMGGIRSLIKGEVSCGEVVIVRKRKISFYYKRIINSDLSTSPIDITDLDRLEEIEAENKIKILSIIQNKVGIET